MNRPSPEMNELYQVALEYFQQGDYYHAVKILKKIIRKEPHWAEPFFQLGQIYKHQKDWKGTLYYHKKTVALDSSNQTAWWNLGIAATALGRLRLAKTIWTKFGFTNFQKKTICIRFQRDQQFEIVWGIQLDPTRVQLVSIPHPHSDRSYKDLILIDRSIVGHTIANNRRIPVFQELDLLKRSIYTTYTCWLFTTSEKAIQTLQQLCQDAELGFEVWSNAIRFKSLVKSGNLPEYFSPEMLPLDQSTEGVQIAISSKHKHLVQEVLGQWKIITLESCSDFIAL